MSPAFLFAAPGKIDPVEIFALFYFEHGKSDDEFSGKERGPLFFFQIDGIEGKDFYADCNGRQCQADVISHTPTPKGYILTLRYHGMTGSFDEKLSITKSGQDRFRFQFGAGRPKPGKPFTVVRCSHTPFEPDQ